VILIKMIKMIVLQSYTLIPVANAVNE